jgi:hypothetical protein
VHLFGRQERVHDGKRDSLIFQVPVARPVDKNGWMTSAVTLVGPMTAKIGPNDLALDVSVREHGSARGEGGDGS